MSPLNQSKFLAFCEKDHEEKEHMDNPHILIESNNYYKCHRQWIKLQKRVGIMSSFNSLSDKD